MSESNILAVVNGREITKEEVQSFINMMGQQGAQFNNEEGMKKVTDELVNQELFYFDALKNGLDKNEDYLKEIERIKESALKQFAVNNFLKDIEIKDSEVEEYYNSHKEYFKKPEMVTASHILVEDEEKAKKVKEEIENGKSFEEAAVEYSTCPSKEKGGSLGQFGRGQMVPEFEQAAFNAEVGTITDPVKSQFGYHIIKVDNKTSEDYSSLDEVKNEVKRQLTALKQQEVYLNKAKDLSKEYKVEKFY
ncbi:peptidylprolyl isomerase [Miniphocaeibacter halophilus]|uniref:Peptidylprolyl isomerase n=1 Tax=Miniphocaeibacter halophilus TaxID=2931922 RepID=A0AC61MQ53_9FIRM|nr:peptidylprolyl isomerase [Miniphocaeibacter halophilus]QQK07483.1 peptidylprolyl isomerase [Miniphocaeibacter halophilus]